MRFLQVLCTCLIPPHAARWQYCHIDFLNRPLCTPAFTTPQKNLNTFHRRLLLKADHLPCIFFQCSTKYEMLHQIFHPPEVTAGPLCLHLLLYKSRSYCCHIFIKIYKSIKRPQKIPSLTYIGLRINRKTCF